MLLALRHPLPAGFLSVPTWVESAAGAVVADSAADAVSSVISGTANGFTPMRCAI